MQHTQDTPHKLPQAQEAEPTDARKVWEAPRLKILPVPTKTASAAATNTENKEKGGTLYKAS
jgi:hypothetical protein